ncbi:hypothetical protein ACFR95_13250, partial [Halolamina salifodinae]|uniref:hypothetical protein n=1 Tax=Halolamina salifodinae TaxID=1202767 RepID=UPI00363403FF
DGPAGSGTTVTWSIPTAWFFVAMFHGRASPLKRLPIRITYRRAAADTCGVYPCLVGIGGRSRDNWGASAATMVAAVEGVVTRVVDGVANVQKPATGHTR